ncbi:hypothetical protein ABKN59_007840 [Abortiporus biennis]
MEVDIAEEQYDPVKLFDTSPDRFPWRSPLPQQIETRRAQMSDLLIFDILLVSGGIRNPDTLYPPSDVATLGLLLNAIEESSYDSLKKDCLIYFLLKWHEDGREEAFSDAKCIPPQFVALADAYWHLDTGKDLNRAISILSDARLNRDYTSKIIQALSLSNSRHDLIRQYVRTAKPLLTEPDDIDAYAIALAESSLMEAWLYQRTFPETDETRPRLIRKILTWCLTPKPRSKVLTHLLAFPFSNFEQGILHSYATNPPAELPAPSIPVIQDLVVLRLVQSGSYGAVVKLDRQINNATATSGRPMTELQRKSIADRKQMIEEILSVMPVVERQLLELELDKAPTKSGNRLSTSSSAFSAGDLSMSWEHIRPPSSVAKANGISARQKAGPAVSDTRAAPIPQRSGAPRFGGQPPFIVGNGVNGSPISANAVRTTGLSTSGSSKAPPFTSGPSVQERRSLFETVGSANQVRNAFYEPPAPTQPSSSLSDSLTKHISSQRERPLSSGIALGDVSSASAQMVVDELLADEEKEVGEEAEDHEQEPMEEDVDMESSFEISHLQTKAKQKAKVKAEAEAKSKPISHSPAKESISASRQRPGRSVSEEPEAEEEQPSSFSFSVFGPPGGSIPSAESFPASGRISSGQPLSRTVTELKLPPGAFFPDEDDEKSPSQPSPTHPASSASTNLYPSVPVAASASSPKSAPKREPKRQSRTSAAATSTSASAPRTRRSTATTKKENLGRSIPGGLMSDDDEDNESQADHDEGRPEENEEEDIVPPLPTPRRQPARKSRSSVTKDTASTSTAKSKKRKEKERDEGVPRPTRRSSRLSAVSASERGSSSERELFASPAKGTRRGGRTSNVSESSGVRKSRTSTRKQRS